MGWIRLYSDRAQVESHKAKRLRPETLWLSVNLFDRYSHTLVDGEAEVFQKRKPGRSEWLQQLSISISCLTLAAKWLGEDEIKSLWESSSKKLSMQQLVNQEGKILQALDWQLLGRIVLIPISASWLLQILCESSGFF